MRILISFIVGLLISFILGDILSRTRNKLKINFPLNHSFLGLILILAGIIYLVLANSDTIKILTAFFLLGSGFGLIIHHLFSENYIFAKKAEQNFATKHENKIERLLEIIPGAATWLAITSPIWLSFALPYAVAYIIILADIYWLVSAIRISVLLVVGYRKMEWAKKQNWLEKLQNDFPDDWDNYYHFVEIHSYKESLEVLLPAYNSIIDSKFPSKKIFLGIGVEERTAPEIITQVSEYAKKNSNKIGGIFFTIHPFGLPGENPGPAAHRNWIMRNAAKEFTKKGIKLEQVLVTTLDADFVIHPQFLGGALHKYLSTPLEVRDKRSFTGVFLYNNNYWQAPTPMRVIATGTAFWQLSEMVGSDKYINFSSLSMNMKSLMDTGLWIPNKVNDDSGFFWTAYYHFKGNYKVIPHYLPISADACLDVNLVKTFENQYLQLKRWAYGVEHIPFIVIQYFKNRDLNFWDKTDKLTFIMWSYFKWGSLALFITFGGMLIPIFNPGFSESVVSKNLSVVSSWILTAAFVGLFSTVYINEKVAPKRPKNWGIFRIFWSYVQWILVPLALVSIATIPAIDAQTRLMLGKYMEYRTTNKARISK